MEATLVVANPDGLFWVVGFGHVVSLLLIADKEIGGGVRIGLIGRAQLDVSRHG